MTDARTGRLRWNSGRPGRQFGGSAGAAACSLPAMSTNRPPFPDSRAWQRTTPGALAPAVPAAAPASATRSGPRVQPPLQEVLRGLDARELEGETVFDQLFGPQPVGDPRLPRL